MGRWNFTDPTDNTTVAFIINPLEGGSPKQQRNFTKKPTLVPGGKIIIQEGAKTPEQMSFSGTITTQAQYNIYTFWFAKRHQIQLKDDLGRTYMIMIQSFKPKRERRGNQFWRHTFEVSAIIVDWQ